MKLAVILLAAGEGTRMKSRHPKALHHVAGVPMASHVLQTALRLGPDRTVVVVGHEADAVRAALGDGPDFVEQKERKGTGHAVLACRDLLEGAADLVLVAYADHPVLRTESLEGLIELHQTDRAVLSFLTFQPADPGPYGRLLRDEEGAIVGIREAAEASEEEQKIDETIDGALCFRGDWLWNRLDRLEPSAVKGERYLTDLVPIAVQEEAAISAMEIPAAEAMGINTRAELAAAERILRDRIRERLMATGITIVDPPSTFVDAEAEVGLDTVLHPQTYVLGRSFVGEGCQIGPGTRIRDSRIGPRCAIESSTIEESVLEEDVKVGPYAHLRHGTHLSQGVRLGSHVETKASRLGPGVKVGHFCYIGDATIGAEANIGAGTVTCNFDGKEKHPTFIEDGAFIGSDTMLVAPVRVGRGAHTGAGSVVNQDVPPYTVAVGVPARMVRKLREAPQKTLEESAEGISPLES
ncbi:MAG: bifunctional UDP-N-acetylglucosamine diphosphorylase/glucosamine-1-phosphate N-acetyltransferase GlmU [Anaerolineae bacterium]